MRRLAVSALSQKLGAGSEPSLKESKFDNDDNVVSKTIVINRSRKPTGDEDDEEGSNTEEQRQLSDAENWWRVRAFLETMELLDKLITYAGDGTVFQLTNISQVVFLVPYLNN